VQIPHLMDRLGSGVRYSAKFQKIIPHLVDRLGSGVRDSACFKFFTGVISEEDIYKGLTHEFDKYERTLSCASNYVVS